MHAALNSSGWHSMNASGDSARDLRVIGELGSQLSATTGPSRLSFRSSRLERLADADVAAAQTIVDLLDVAVRTLPLAFASGQFVFTIKGLRDRDGAWRLSQSGASARYSAIAALGLLKLPEHAQREILAGISAYELVGDLVSKLHEETGLGTAALVCWAAAQARHDRLPRALQVLASIAGAPAPAYVVDISWVISAFVAARAVADVEEQLDRARQRLLAAHRVLFPRHIGADGSWYRAHVGCFADQVYPVQALSRLHASADDQQALAVATAIATAICRAQGDSGQWWWHYDSRNGRVVEEYPVYSVHQHAMAPMALLDYAEAGGESHLANVARGIRWLVHPPETREPLVMAEPPITWRKVARQDWRKSVRGLRAATTRVRPGWRVAALDRRFPPRVVDHECRPYELGWLLMTWLP
jgi:hypothetical protein